MTIVTLNQSSVALVEDGSGQTYEANVLHFVDKQGVTLLKLEVGKYGATITTSLSAMKQKPEVPEVDFKSARKAARQRSGCGSCP